MLNKLLHQSFIALMMLSTTSSYASDLVNLKDTLYFDGKIIEIKSSMNFIVKKKDDTDNVIVVSLANVDTNKSSINDPLRRFDNFSYSTIISESILENRLDVKLNCFAQIEDQYICNIGIPHRGTYIDLTSLYLRRGMSLYEESQYQNPFFHEQYRSIMLERRLN